MFISLTFLHISQYFKIDHPFHGNSFNRDKSFYLKKSILKFSNN